MDFIAAESMAARDCAFETSVLTRVIRRSTACAVVITCTAMVCWLEARPSLTDNVTEFVPTGRTTTATMPVADAVVAPFANQKYCSGSPSGSEDNEAFKTTVALELFIEITSGTVAVASATGGWFG